MSEKPSKLHSLNDGPTDDKPTQIAAQSNSMLAKPAFGKQQYEMKITRAKDKNLRAAEHSIYQIAQEIKNFENDLTEDEEAFLCIIGGPSGSAIFLNGIIPLGLDKVVFVGQNERGEKARLIQHVSQINIMLQSVPIAPEIEPRRFGIGFHVQLDDNDDADNHDASEQDDD